MLQEQPKENEAPQVSGSSPWHAQVRLKDKRTQLLAAGRSPCGALAVGIGVLPVLQGISAVDHLPSVNNEEMPGGRHTHHNRRIYQSEQFHGYKAGSLGVLHLCEKRGFARLRAHLRGALLGTDIHGASGACADSTARMWEPSDRG